MSTQGENLPFVDLNMIREYIYAEVVYMVAILLRAIRDFRVNFTHIYVN